jgi:UDP-glucose 4-epimerase
MIPPLLAEAVIKAAANRPIVVTGGAGFIGSHLVESLCEIGACVKVIDDLSTGHRENLVGTTATLHEGSILDRDLVAEVVKDAGLLFHLGAFISVAGSVADPQTCDDINVTGMQVVLDEAAAAGVRRVIFASSSSVYGDAQSLPSREDQPAAPESPYAASKAKGEELLKAASQMGLSTVGLRYFNVFGPRQSPDAAYAAVIPAFFKHLLQGTPPTIYGTGEQTRDFISVNDVVAANFLAASCPAELTGEVFNCGSGQGVSLLDLLAVIQTITGTSIEPTFAPARAGDVPHSLACMEAARRVLAFVPTASLGGGLEATASWLEATAPKA